jgi:hypothetical protein
MAHDPASLDKPFASLQAFDWGGDATALQEIDAAVIAAHGDAALRADLEKRLSALLGGGCTLAVKEYACRKLAAIGTAASVPALSALLPDRDHSHMARFALQQIAAPEAAAALRKAAGDLQGDLKIGMISSLAGRGDAASVPLLAALLRGDSRTAVAAAEALGRIRTDEAVQALAAAADVADAHVAAAIVDARLAGAEAQLRHGRRREALATYRALADAAAHGTTASAKAARLAATRGILACLDTAAS